MSKATEWAATAKERPRVMLASSMSEGVRVIEATLDDRGYMTIGSYEHAFHPGNAMALAHWILDTFGESQADRREP